MSWDILLIRPRKALASVSELEHKDDVVPLGPLDSVLNALATALPAIDLSDPTWGSLESETFSIEFNIGDGDPVDSLMLHVRGGDEALGPIGTAADALGSAALDCSKGEFIDWSTNKPATSLTRWRAYRDRIIGDED